MKNELLTAEEVRKYLRIPPSTLYKLARDREIPSFKVGRHWRFKKEKFKKWLKKQEKMT